jgi:restriction system protein
VQRNHWKKTKVSIRELFGVMHAKGAQGGIFVCSGEYTNPAVEFAQENGIRLIDSVALDALIREVKQDHATSQGLKLHGAVKVSQW